MIQSRSCICITAGKTEVADNNEIDLTSLNKAIARAIQEEWKIAPVSAHRKYASLTRSCIEAPSSNPTRIIRWAPEFPEANWCVETGRESKLAILEANHEIGQEALCELCNDGWEIWPETLRFQDRRSTSLLFRYGSQRVRFLPSQVKGIAVKWTPDQQQGTPDAGPALFTHSRSSLD